MEEVIDNLGQGRRRDRNSRTAIIALSQKLLGNPELPSAPVGLIVIFSGISNSILLTVSNQLDLQLNTTDLTMLG